MRQALQRFVLVGMSALAGTASAQIGAFDWTLVGNASGTGSATPTNLHVIGPDESGCTPPVTYFETVLPVGGTLHVLLDFQNLDAYYIKGQAWYDGPAWVIDGQWEMPPSTGDYPFTPEGWPTGPYEFDFEADAGQRVGLGVWSLDCGYGPGVADFHDLVLVPKPWSTHAAALDPRALWSAPQPAYPSKTIMAEAGDVDLDGLGDLVLGGSFTDGADVRIIAGVDGATLLSTSAPVFGGAAAVAGVGDVDGDGRADVAAGHPSASGMGSLAGNVTVFSGADGSVLMQASGTAQYEHLGERAVGTGDIDLDGVPDLAVRLGMLTSTMSQVRVISGATGVVLDTYLPTQQTKEFGMGLAGPGDLTGDGVPDVLVGTPNSNLGVALFSGASSFIAKTYPNPGLDSFGAVVAPVGDVDAGGKVDFVASASDALVVFSAESAVPIVIITDLTSGGALGDAVAGGLDVNGDGRLDVVAGIPNEALGGALRVYDALDGSLLAVLTASKAQQSLGKAVAMPADLDGDRFGDVAGLSEPMGSPFQLTVRTWSQLTHPGPPTLAHTGDPLPGQLITVTIANALPGAPGFLVVGGALLDLPVAGGVLAPSADVVIPIVADVAGNAQVEARWPDGLAVWTSIWMQAWMHDPAGPAGFTASDALAASQL